MIGKQKGSVSLGMSPRSLAQEMPYRGVRQNIRQDIQDERPADPLRAPTCDKRKEA